MKIADVAQLSPLDRFLYWIRERHQVYLRRRAGKPKPWTDDEILQRFFFTNPYRENDKVTQWLRDKIREPLRDDPRVMFATVCFRWFNLPSTAEALMRGRNLLLSWDAADAFQRLDTIRKAKGQVFTGAYMINSPGGEPKLEAILRRISNVWGYRLVGKSLESAHRELTQFDGMGGFMAYEVVCDLRYTYLLEHAPDKLTWCNPGPGCIRGLYRIAGEEIKNKSNATAPPLPRDWRKRMTDLLAITQQRLLAMPRFEMREIEHSLCEFDKYSRALAGDGKMKRTFQGV